jgi:hypothetical protein
LSLTAVVLIPGCTPKGLKGVVPVSGKITVNGEPLSRVVINFCPMDVNVQRSASAMSGEDGTFKLTTFMKDDGALPGSYKITLAKLVFSLTPEEVAALEAKGKEYNITSDNIMPKQYQSLATTPLTCDVQAGKNDEVLIDITEPLLKSKYSKKWEK